MRWKCLTFLLIILLCNHANAAWINKKGETLPDADETKAIASFGSQLIFTDNEDELFRKWAIPSKTVDIQTVVKISINKPISAFIIFSGCKADTSGNCHVSMRFKVIQPDGKVYSETPPMEVWHDKPATSGTLSRAKYPVFEGRDRTA